MSGSSKKLFKKFLSPASASYSRILPQEQPTPPSPPPHPPIPAAFLCPVSSLLMLDPTLTDSGDSLDLHCLQACKNLNFTPPNLNLPPPSFPFISNRNLNSAIHEWCHTSGHPLPIPISPESALHFVNGLKSLPNPPPPPPPPFPFFFDREQEMKILDNLQEDSDPSSKESALHSLVTMETTPCSPRILAALIPLLQTNFQTQAAHVFLDLAFYPNHRAHILRSGAIPHLITVLNTGVNDARAIAAATLQKLARDEPFFSLTIGALGAIKPLLDTFCDNLLEETDLNRVGLALYQLSLHCQANVELLAENGGVLKLMEMAGDGMSPRIFRKQALKILNCLVGVETGREEVMDVGNMKKLLKLVKEGEGVGLHSLNVLYNVCRENSGRFREVGVAAGGEVVLAEEMEHWGPNGKEMAIGMLSVIRGELNEGEQLDEIRIE